MKFLNTEMYMVTFSITVFELVMLLFQVIHYLQRTSDKKRLHYLILLIMLIVHNICSGFMPDDDIPLPIAIQNIIAFLGGFTMSIYFVYYFYKAFDLERLRFFVMYGSLLFLVAPFLFLFILPYVYTGNLALARQLTVVVPFIYGLAFVYAVTRAFIHKFKMQGLYKLESYSIELVVAAYIALLCWITLPVIVFFGDFQVLQHSITNSGLLMMTIIYIKTSIVQARLEYEQLQTNHKSLEEVIHSNYERYRFTPREIEVTSRLMRGIPYKLIAQELGISEKTINRHVSNAFSKTGVSNKVELINVLEARQQLNHKPINNDLRLILFRQK